MHSADLLRTAYIAQSVSTDPKQATEKAYGDDFVGKLKEDIPNKLGWSLTDGAPDYISTKTKFLSAVGKSGLIAWFGHGHYTRNPYQFIGLDMYRVSGVSPGLATTVKAADLPNDLTYDFVFLNACGSATAGNSESDALIQKFNSKVYIGWDNVVTPYAAGQYADNLIDGLETDRSVDSVSQAAWVNVEGVRKLAPGQPRVIWRSNMLPDDRENYRVNKKL
jgi:hypothetical protein